MKSRHLIVLFPFTPRNPYLQKIRSVLEGEESIQLACTESNEQIAELVNEFGRALVIFCVREKEDLRLVFEGLGEWARSVRENLVRVIGFCEIDHPQLPAMLIHRGCADLFTERLRDKALKHKVAQSLKILESYRVHSTVEKKEADARSEKKIRKLPPLAIGNDVWLLRRGSDVRRVQSKWIVEMLGPGPVAGNWESDGKDRGFWTWNHRPNSKFTHLLKGTGAWIYKGRKPEFDRALGLWRFLGESPELVFKKDDKIIAVRFRAVEDAIELAENSPQANAKLADIMRSIENEFRLQGRPNDQSILEVEMASKSSIPDVVPLIPAPSAELVIRLRSSKADAGKTVLAQPIEITESDFIVEVPSQVFSEDDNLILVIDDGLNRSGSVKQVKAILKQIISTDGEADQVAIRIDDGLRLKLEPVAEALRQRQEEILNFMKAVRGW